MPMMIRFHDRRIIRFPRSHARTRVRSRRFGAVAPAGRCRRIMRSMAEPVDAVVVDDLVVRRGRTEVLRGIDVAGADGPGDRAARPERLRQDHPRCARWSASQRIAHRGTIGVFGLPGRPPRSAPRDRLHGAVGERSTTTSRSSRTSTTSAGCSARPKSDVDRVVAEVDLALRAHEPRVAALAAGSAAASRSASPCSARRSCSCSTSRPSGSTRCCARTCGSCSRRLAASGTTLLVVEPRDGRGPRAATACCSCATARSSPTTPRPACSPRPAPPTTTTPSCVLIERAAEAERHDPAADPRDRGPGARAGPPRPAHDRHAARGARAADRADRLDLRRDRRLRQPSARRCSGCSRSS